MTIFVLRIIHIIRVYYSKVSVLIIFIDRRYVIDGIVGDSTYTCILVYMRVYNHGN